VFGVALIAVAYPVTDYDARATCLAAFLSAMCSTIGYCFMKSDNFF